MASNLVHDILSISCCIVIASHSAAFRAVHGVSIGTYDMIQIQICISVNITWKQAVFSKQYVKACPLRKYSSNRPNNKCFLNIMNESAQTMF